MFNRILDPKMPFKTLRIGLKLILPILIGHLWGFPMTKKYPYVRSVYILGEGAEEKEALGRVDWRRNTIGGEGYAFSHTWGLVSKSTQ